MQHKFTTPERIPKQLELPIQLAPAKVRAWGLRDAHPCPLVSTGKRRDGSFPGSFRVPAVEAWAYREIELRAANSYPSLIFDLDGRDATMRLAYLIENALLPRFSWAVTRPRSGGTHVVWNLARPVHRGATARKHPLSKLARIADYYAIELGADVGYTGVLSHNPMSKAQGRGLVTTWGSRRDPYSLEELAAVIPKGWRRPPTPSTAIGRNCGLFASCMKWSGSPTNVGCDVLTVALTLNLQFEPPLPVDEVEGIAKSVERYRARWTFYTPEQRTLWGRERQRRGVENRRRRNNLDQRDATIIHLRREGLKQAEIAERVAVSQQVVSYTLRRNTNLLHR